MWFVDVNECLTDNGECEQRCDNIDGSYQCSCWNGFELTSDNNTCTGMKMAMQCIANIIYHFISDTLRYW